MAERGGSTTVFQDWDGSLIVFLPQDAAKLPAVSVTDGPLEAVFVPLRVATSARWPKFTWVSIPVSRSDRAAFRAASVASLFPTFAALALAWLVILSAAIVGLLYDGRPRELLWLSWTNLVLLLVCLGGAGLTTLLKSLVVQYPRVSANDMIAMHRVHRGFVKALGQAARR